MAEIHVASSWRNQFYPSVVEALRAAGGRAYVQAVQLGYRQLERIENLDDKRDRLSIA